MAEFTVKQFYKKTSSNQQLSNRKQRNVTVRDIPSDSEDSVAESDNDRDDEDYNPGANQPSSDESDGDAADRAQSDNDGSSTAEQSDQEQPSTSSGVTRKRGRAQSRGRMRGRGRCGSSSSTKGADLAESDNDGSSAAEQSDEEEQPSTSSGAKRNSGRAQNRGRMQGRGRGGSSSKKGHDSGGSTDRGGSIEWSRGNLLKSDDDTKFTGNTQLPEEVMELDTPYQFFRFFWTQELMEQIVEQTILYSVQVRPEKPLDIDTGELDKFLSVMLWMSLVRVSSSRLYWSDTMGFPQIINALPMRRFEEIKRFIHFNDNTTAVEKDQPEHDRLHKVRPLLEKLRSRMLLIPKEENLSIDEQMVAYKGKSLLKQYNKNKPHKWGYKIFVLSGVSGLVYDFEVYTGQPNEEMDESLNEVDCGKSGNVVVRLLRTVPRNCRYKVYFDNWFTSTTLQVYLLGQGIFAVGTVRPNRVRDTGLSEEKQLKQSGRGSYEEVVASIDSDEPNLSMVRWFDNRCVNLMSTYAGSEPAGTVRRWVKSTRSYQTVPCPKVVSEYNRHMGGVDLLDSLNGLYRNRLRSKKWYFRLFTHFVDMTVVAAWLLYRRKVDQVGEASNTLSLAAFKAEVASSLVLAGKQVGRAKRGRPSAELEVQLEEKRSRSHVAPAPSVDIRLDHVDHWPECTDDRLRCKMPNCKGQSRTKCSKCGVHLCLSKSSNCFVKYHTT